MRNEYTVFKLLSYKITEYSFITNSNLLLIYLNSIRVSVTFDTHGPDRMNVLYVKRKSEKKKKSKTKQTCGPVGLKVMKIIE